MSRKFGDTTCVYTCGIHQDRPVAMISHIGNESLIEAIHADNYTDRYVH